jgi:hypothetical protein
MNVTKPNFMRYQRVAELVIGEAALKERLGTKTDTVLKPNGEKVEFQKELVDLTERIHAAGFDVNVITKQQILKYAVDVILWGGDSGLPPVPPRSEAEAAAPPAPKKRAPAKVKSVRKPKAVEKKPTAVPEEKPAAETAPVTPPVAAPKPKPAAEPVGVSRQVTISSPPSQCAASNFPFVVGCAANANLMAAAQLMEIHDRSPEGKEILARLNKIIEDVLKRTTIPSNLQIRA